MIWSLQVHIIDVGQGEASLIRLMGYKKEESLPQHPDKMRQILIDGGLKEKAGDILSYLNDLEFADEPIDIIISTHFDKDHVGGLSVILELDNLFYTSLIIAEMIQNVVFKNKIYDENSVCLPYSSQQYSGVAAAAITAIYGLYENVTIATEIVNEAFKINHDVWNGEEDIIIVNRVFEIYQDITKLKGEDLEYQEGLIPPNYINYGCLSMNLRNIIHNIVQASINFHNANVGGLNELAGEIFEVLKRGISSYNYNNIPLHGTQGRFRSTKVFAASDIRDKYMNFGRLVKNQIRRNVGWRQLPNNRKFFCGYHDLSGFMERDIFQHLNEMEMAETGARRELGDPSDEGEGPEVIIVSVDSYVGEKIINITDNECSIALLVKLGDFLYYTAGDLENRTEEELARYLRHRLEMKLTAFKCGHHGSKNSTSDTFLNFLEPVVAFISCGKNNYGHPHEETLERLLGSSFESRIKRCYLTSYGDTGQSQKYFCSYDENQIACNSFFRIIGHEEDKTYASRRVDIVLCVCMGSDSFNISYIDKDGKWKSDGTFVPDIVIEQFNIS